MHRVAAILMLVPTLVGCPGDEGSCPEGNLGCDDGGKRVVGGGDDTARGVIGQWELDYVVVARDSVQRPVEVAEVTWNLEIYAASQNEFTDLYDVSALVTGGSLCVLTSGDFASGDTGCAEIGDLLTGDCANHSCTRVIDRAVTGRYDPVTRTFDFGRQLLEGFVADQEAGYFEVSANLFHDALPEDGTEVEDCGENCFVSLVPAGLFADTWQTYAGETRRSRFKRVSARARATAPPPESELALAIGDEAATSRILLGDYGLRVLFYEDADEVRTQVGELAYQMEIFEVRPIGTVGEYQWLGGIEADSLCWAVDAGGQCDPFDRVSLGRCASVCAPEAQYAVTGFYNEFTGVLRMNRVNVGMYAGGDDSFLSVSVSIHIEGDSEFDEDGLAHRECTDTCNWSLTTGGANPDGLVAPATGSLMAVAAEKIP